MRSYHDDKQAQAEHQQDEPPPGVVVLMTVSLQSLAYVCYLTFVSIYL